MGRFTEYLEENTDVSCPVMTGIVKEQGDWTDDDEALQMAIARGDDAEARNLVERLGFDIGDDAPEEDTCFSV